VANELVIQVQPEPPVVCVSKLPFEKPGAGRQGATELWASSWALIAINRRNNDRSDFSACFFGDISNFLVV
jgi:hypothetical protein